MLATRFTGPFPPTARAIGYLLALVLLAELSISCIDSHALAQSDGRPVRVFRPTGTGPRPVLQKDIAGILERARAFEKVGLLTAKARIQVEKVERPADLRKVSPQLSIPDRKILPHVVNPQRLVRQFMHHSHVPIAKGALTEEGPKVRTLDDEEEVRTEDPSRWIATLMLDFANSEFDFCTATTIGPRVVLTAAHCISPREDVAIRFSDDDERLWRLDCERHPAYGDFGFRRFFDYALCRSSEDLPAEVSLTDGRLVPFVFERISLDAGDATPSFRDIHSRWLVLAGYGCSFWLESVPDGDLRWGFARISFNNELRLTTGSPWRDDSYVICAGDSGGGAYRVKSKDAPHGPRAIVAINSANSLRRNLSFLAKTSSPAFVRFFHSWRRRSGYPKVCGVDRDIDARCHP